MVVVVVFVDVSNTDEFGVVTSCVVEDAVAAVDTTCCVSESIAVVVGDGELDSGSGVLDVCSDSG